MQLFCYTLFLGSAWEHMTFFLCLLSRLEAEPPTLYSLPETRNKSCHIFCMKFYLQTTHRVNSLAVAVITRIFSSQSPMPHARPFADRRGRTPMPNPPCPMPHALKHTPRHSQQSRPISRLSMTRTHYRNPQITPPNSSPSVIRGTTTSSINTG